MKIRPISRALVFSLALIGWTWSAPAAHAQGEAGIEPRQVRSSLREQEPAIPASLQETYRRIAAYWEDQNARAIAQMASGGRVYVVVQRDGVGERLAASQLQYVLQEIFEASQEVEVRFPAYTAYDPRAGTAYAVGERVWLDDQDPELRYDRIFVSARSDRGRWVLTEIRLTVD
jgi:hypothetical protein